MDLVPTGKTRVMVAQQFSNPLSEGFDSSGNGLETGGMDQGLPSQELDDNNQSLDDNQGFNDDVNIQPEEEKEMSPKEKGRKTLTTYVYEKLQNYGYPGRRLQEFKSEFVKESISPDGVKDIEVVIPDKKYPDERGYTDTIENEELKEISHEVNQMFGLNFNGADRSDGKWTIKFTSADLASPEEEITSDNLDEVYGKSDKGKGSSGKSNTDQKSFPKAASTIHEMIKDQKNNTVINLKKMIGDK